MAALSSITAWSQACSRVLPSPKVDCLGSDGWATGTGIYGTVAYQAVRSALLAALTFTQGWFLEDLGMMRAARVRGAAQPAGWARRGRIRVMATMPEVQDGPALTSLAPRLLWRLVSSPNRRILRPR
jgi:hypothetical protein